MDDILDTAPRVVSAPFAGGGSSTSILVSPAGKQSSPVQSVRRSFRRSFLDRKDPFEAAGRQMWKFTFSSSYDLDGQPPEPVADEIRERLNMQLQDGNLAEAQLQVIDFDDASIAEESARRFMITSTNTRRNTLVTVNTYLRAYGDHLYYSVRSYILPDVSVWKLLLAIMAGCLAFTLSGYVPMGRLVFLVTALTYLRRFISDLLAGDTLRLALRKQFPGPVDSGSFDDDDTTAFLKTNVSLTLRTVADVLERYGINADGLRLTLQRLEVINVNTGGGSIIGAAIGGIANRIAAEVRA